MVWDIVERNKIYDLVDNNTILIEITSYAGIEDPECPRSQFILLNGISEDNAVQIYWKELYIQWFDTIIEDLEAKLSSEQYQLCAKIEELLLNGIIETDKDPVKKNITKNYGTGTSDQGALLYQLENVKLKEELRFLKD